ncbi:MAG: hypothetical protein WCY28_02280 [Candidatus Shapirobacteria bacterium]|jgi:hypothetical protein
MRKNMRGYIYVPLLLSVLIVLGFVLSGGFILSKKSSSTTESNELYTLVDKEAISPHQTLQMLTLDLIDPDCGCVP